MFYIRGLSQPERLCIESVYSHGPPPHPSISILISPAESRLHPSTSPDKRPPSINTSENRALPLDNVTGITFHMVRTLLAETG